MRRMTNTGSALAVVPGSLAQTAQDQDITLAEAFLDCACIVLVDTSGSMSDQDSRGNRKRYDVACEELAKLQHDIPGKIGVISFSSGDPKFCPGGVPEYLGAGTDMAGALTFMQIADGLDIKLILISDGQPDSASETLAIARKFKTAISTIFVGPESDSRSRGFLADLAAATGGQTALAAKAAELAPKIEKLLLTDGKASSI